MALVPGEVPPLDNCWKIGTNVGVAPEIEKRIRASTAEFHALQVTQRPTFVIDTEIGDRAVFSGVVKLEPLTATLDSMLDDATAYAAHKAHFGDPPAK